MINLTKENKLKVEHVGLAFCLTASFVIVAAVVWIAGYIFINGGRGFSLSFIFGGIENGMYDVNKSGIFPMVMGTVSLVLLMTVFVAPLGVLAAIYLHEYAAQDSSWTRWVRMAINNLAGVPSIVFGLFGLGFFVQFVGGGMDKLAGSAEPVWGKPALLWAALTMALLTVPVVIVATEEALRSIPQIVRDASTGLGATRFYTITRIVIPQAMPGILTGCILAVSRGAGEVAPILFVGAANMAPPPYALDKQFMELGTHIYVLATQSPGTDKVAPLLFGTAVVLLLLTFSLNLLAIITRGFLRARYQQLASI